MGVTLSLWDEELEIKRLQKRISQVMPIGDRPAAEHTAAGGTRWLIHSKHIGSE